MLSGFAKRSFSSTSAALKKVTVLGAAGGIGQPLSLLLKLNPKITQLALYDLVNTPGVAADIAHVNTVAKTTGYKGAEQLADALKGADVVVIPAGVPRKPGMTRDDLFNTNASIVATLVDAAAKSCPNAHLLIISNPVNSTVPIAAEILKRHNVYDPAKVFGVTTLDVVRANTFIGEATGKNPSEVDTTVIGGHAGITILPLFSQLGAASGIPQDKIEALTHRTQFGGDEVVKAKDGAGSATLSMAFAADRFVGSLLRGMAGEKVTECAYVNFPVEDFKDAPAYFSRKVTLSSKGVGATHPLGKLSASEQKALDAMMPELKSSIEKGIKFAQAWQPK